jgi:molybdopterin synthase catalytic subunit
MRVRVLFFGVLKDLVGRSSEDAEFPDGATLGAVFERYGASFPRLREMAGSIVMARNREFAELSTKIDAGDEVAFLPPVSGGTAAGAAEIRENGNYFALTRRAIDPRAIATRLITGAEGAVVTFEGTVRNNTGGRLTRFLEYEAYESMALGMMARIGREIAAAGGIGSIAIVHRLGRLLVGETSVAVVVTAPHRRPAFAAALEGIDRLKKTVPIWKKEYFGDGEVWVEGEWNRDVQPAR